MNEFLLSIKNQALYNKFCIDVNDYRIMFVKTVGNDTYNLTIDWHENNCISVHELSQDEYRKRHGGYSVISVSILSLSDNLYNLFQSLL